jgi:hypothetical protein
MNAHPLVITVAIIVAVSIVGVLISYFRKRFNLKGYEELAGDVQALGRAMRANVFRDGDDLVLSGAFSKLPTVVRFSYSDNTPGLNVSMKAPATFTMSVTPKAAKTGEGRMQVRTTDEMFDARFVTRTDNPTQVKMFLSGKQAMANLHRLCCSQKTFLTVSKGNVELSELVIPAPYTARHVGDHLDAMAKLATALASMPGADTVKVKSFKEKQSWITQIAVAVLAITGVAVVWQAVRERRQSLAPVAPVAAASLGPIGMPAADAEKIGTQGWRLVTQDDLDPAGASWLRDQGVAKFTGRVSGAFAGDGKPAGTAYLMLPADPNAPKRYRIVILSGEQVLSDAAYPMVAGIARVPHDNFAAVQWQATTPLAPDGDGLLVLTKPDDSKSAFVLYSSGGKLARARPSDYNSVPVE